MQPPTLDQLDSAARDIYRHMQPSPLLNWPLLSWRAGCEVWVKHENHNPTGAFKVRGGLLYLQRLRQREPHCPGVASYSLEMLRAQPAMAHYFSDTHNVAEGAGAARWLHCCRSVTSTRAAGSGWC